MTDDFKFNPNTLDYLKQFNQGGHILPGETSAPRKRKKLKVNHKEAVTYFLKAIKLSKMDDELKSILRLRIWGADPNNFKPLSCFQIAERLDVRESVVEDFEREAKEKLHNFLKGKSLSDIIYTFNKGQLGGNVLTDSKGKPLTG